MNGRLRYVSGRADPFGLLVLAVLLALTITIGIQSQATVVDESTAWQSFPKAAQLLGVAAGPAASGHR